MCTLFPPPRIVQPRPSEVTKKSFSLKVLFLSQSQQHNHHELILCIRSWPTRHHLRTAALLCRPALWRVHRRRIRPNEDGITPTSFSGRIVNHKISPQNGEHDGRSIVFPRLDTTYVSVMTSRDGTSISGTFHVDPNVTGVDSPELLRQLMRSAAAIQGRLIDDAAQAEVERQALAGEAHNASTQRDFLLARTQEGDAQRADNAARIAALDAEAHRADGQRDLLANAVQQADTERRELHAELCAARDERALNEITRLHQALSDSTTSRPSVSPQANQPPDGFANTLSELASAIREMRSGSNYNAGSSQPPTVTIRESHPFITSHGEHVCPMIDPIISSALTQVAFEPYRWLKSATSIGSRIRLGLTEMNLMLEDPHRFTSWADRVTFTFTPTQWCLYASGSDQSRLELCAALRINDPQLHSIFVFARQRADPSHLADYVNGTVRVNGVPLLGSHNGITNLAHSPAAPARDPNQRNGGGGRGGGGGGGSGGGGGGGGGSGGGSGGGGGRNSQNRRALQGGAADLPNLSHLNALVRS